MSQELFKDADFLRKVIDAIPSLTFVVDDDVRIIHLNSTAVSILGIERDRLLLRRGGEILHCIHAGATPGGCGHAPRCRDCLIRNSVGESLRGNAVYRQTTPMQLDGAEGPSEVFFRVTTAPFEYNGTSYVLLTLEDETARHRAERAREALVAELQEALAKIRTLRGLIPICAWCKKVRDDAGYWRKVEDYIRDHSEADFSHGICPQCFKDVYPDYGSEKG